MRPVPAASGHATSTRLSIMALGACLALVTLAAPVAAEDNLPRYWEVHAALLSLATFFFVASYLALFLKWLKRLEPLGIPLTSGLARLWLKAHVWLGVAGVAFAVAGIAVGFYMVDQAYSGTHLRLTHSYVGLATLAIVIPPLVTGLLWRVVRRGKLAVKWWHLVLGFMGIVVMLAGAISGWALE